MDNNLRAAYLEMRKAAVHDFSSEFLEYLYHYIFRAAMQGREFKHLGVAAICSGFPNRLILDFGVMAGSVLKHWGIATYGDLGQAIFTLAKYGCFKLQDQDKLEDYAAAGPIVIP